jgi:HSP20 family protein
MFIGNIIPWRGKDAEIKSGDASSQSAIAHFHSEVDRLFERFFGEPFWGGRLSEGLRSWGSTGYPALDVSEQEDAITVRAEVPGVDPKDLDISVSGDVLVLSGEKKEESEQRGDSFYHSERSFGSFRRTIALPATVDREKMSAGYDKGVLTIRLAKSEKAVAKRIPVSVKK